MSGAGEVSPGAWAALVAGGLAVQLLAEWRGWRWLRALAKGLSSAGFVGLALALGATRDPYGRWILAGLLLSLVGDLLLLLNARRALFLGLGAFLLAHLAYLAAFWVRGLAPVWTLIALAVLTVPRWKVLHWLLPAIDGPGMRRAVTLYASVITLMLAAAAGTAAAWPGWRILTGALLFYLSDLFVARQRFVAPGLTNRLIGLPLYYAGQVLLAWSAV